MVRTATAVWFPRPREVELRAEPVPDPGPGEVLIRSVVSGVSHGTEMLVYRGQAPRELELDLPTLEGNFGFPIKYGYSSVGRVVEVGPGVSRLRHGDAVFALHPHQDVYTLPVERAVALPGALDPELGVFLANLETAVNVALDAHPHLGDRVVIFGQGVVGLLLAQLIRRAGAGLVVTVDPIPRRRQLSEACGADLALAPGPEVSDRVREMTKGTGADVVLEASGSGAALNSAIDCAGFQAVIAVCSWYGCPPVNLGLGGAFHRRRLRIISSQVSNLDSELRDRWSFERRRDYTLQLLPQLRLDGLITHRIPFRLAGGAYRLIDEHPEDTVQVVLSYQEEPCTR